MPFSEILVNSNLPHKTIFGGIYQKIFSIYGRQNDIYEKRKNFFDQLNINILKVGINNQPPTVIPGVDMAKVPRFLHVEQYYCYC